MLAGTDADEIALSDATTTFQPSGRLIGYWARMAAAISSPLLVAAERPLDDVA